MMMGFPTLKFKPQQRTLSKNVLTLIALGIPVGWLFGLEH